jgi:hypothetical protein
MQRLSHAEAIARIGPRPPGDAAGMLELARELRQVAGRLGRTTRVRLDNWESPRASRTKAQIDDATATASTATCELNSAAGTLEREAGELADLQRRWAGRYAALTGQCPP